MKEQWSKLSLNNGLLDYLTLHNSLSDYANPRDKISRLIREGSIIRVKKGLYVVANARAPISKEMLANLVYGPSYVSLHYALSYYGMIPERVETISSVTTKKSRGFSTPLGQFSYHHVALSAYATGVHIEYSNEQEHFLIATREKALCDLVASVNSLKNPQSMRTFLLDDLRVDRAILLKLSSKAIAEIALGYKNNNIKLLQETLKEIK